MTLATCTECRAPFYRDESETWKVRCLACWRASKRPKDDPDALMTAFRRGFEAGRAVALDQLRPAAIDKTRLRELLQLAHPDKHGGSPLAVRVTQWLNEIKRGLPA